VAEYKPYRIAEFKTGTYSYLQPWIRPADAFEPLTNAYIYRGTVNKRAGMSQFGNTLADNNPVMGIMQYIAQNGTISLVVASTVNLYVYNPGANTFGLVGTHPTFTGNITQFFNWTNWQPTTASTPLLWMCNNKDRVTTYDGTNANQPTITIDGSGTTITTALDVVVYKERLLLIRPTLSSGGIQNQSIYWSAQFNPANWLVDTAGNGGFSVAPTSDSIQSVEFIRDNLLVFFTNSTWLFKFTGNANDLFQWVKINDSKSTTAPYGSISYDERSTSVGATGLIASDGVNVQRYDIPIIEYYENNFSIEYIEQTFAQRYDNLNQGWMLYVSNETPFPLVGSVAPGSDSALVYNFVENTWSTYTFSFPMTCLGLFYRPQGTTWASLTQAWEDTDMPWNAYSGQKDMPILLGGGTDGKVYFLDDQTQVEDNGHTITSDIVTTQWNPVIEAGQKMQFGYIDIYYYVASVDAANPIFFDINFYADDSNNVVATRRLTMDGPAGSEYYFKRIYLNLIGQFVKMEFIQDSTSLNSYFQLVGFIIWIKPAGRLTP
jgi:hypothetical protein